MSDLLIQLAEEFEETAAGLRALASEVEQTWQGFPVRTSEVMPPGFIGVEPADQQQREEGA